MVAHSQLDGGSRFINADDVYHIFILNSHGRVPETAVLGRRYQIVGETMAFGHKIDASYRESSQIQFTSQVFPPSAEYDCSMRAALGERLSQT